MIALNVCPSTLQEGFDTYSPIARKLLFDGREVSPVLSFNSPNNNSSDHMNYLQHVGRISLSGVQPKSSLVLDEDNQLVKPLEGHHGTYILKPAPSSYALLERKYCPANEHLTMQMASQVYHIETAANAVALTFHQKVVSTSKKILRLSVVSRKQTAAATSNIPI